jgi:hypothetical protein
MGICSNITLIGGLLILTGIISSGTLVGGGIHVIKNFKDYNSCHLNYGILTGIISMCVFIINLLLYSISCVKKSSLIMPSLCIIGSMIYNIYLIDKMDETCDYYYKNENKNLWNFYIYYISALIVSIVLIVVGFIYNCSKKKN